MLSRFEAIGIDKPGKKQKAKFDKLILRFRYGKTQSFIDLHR